MKKLLFLVLLFATLINVSCHKDEIDPIPEEEEELDGGSKTSTITILTTTRAIYYSDGEVKYCDVYICYYKNKKYASLRSSAIRYKDLMEINSNGDKTWQGISVKEYKYYIDYKGIRYFFKC